MSAIKGLAGRLLFDRPYVLLTIVSLSWGGNAVAGKLAVGNISPMALTCTRWTLACIILSIIGRARILEDFSVIREHRVRLFLLGAIGLGWFSVLLYLGLHYTTAVNISIEQAAIPIFIILVNFVVYRQGIGPIPVFGVFLTLIGVAVVASHGDLRGLLALDVNRGDALMICASFLYASYSVGLRNRPPMHWLAFLAVLTGAGALATLPAAIWEYASGDFVLTWQALTILAYIVIFPSMLAQLFFARGVELIGANRSGIFSNFVPVFGALMAVLFLGEPFQIYHGVAFGLVMVGVMLAERYRDRPWRFAGRMRG